MKLQPFLLSTLGLAGVLTLSAPTFATDDMDLPQPDANAARADIPDLFKWDLTPLFSSDEAWQQEYDRLRGELPRLESYKGSLGDPAALLECLRLYFELHDAVNNITLYPQLQEVADLANDDYHAMSSQGGALMMDLMSSATFIRSELLALSDKDLTKAYKKSKGELEEYRHYIGNLRRRQSRVLSDDGERVMALAGDNLWAEIDLNEILSVSEKSFDAMLTDIVWPTVTNAEGEQVQFNLSLYSRLRASPDRAVRQAAVHALMSTLYQYRHVFSSTLAGQAEETVFFANARHYDTAREAYLDKDDIDPAVYDNLITTIHANSTRDAVQRVETMVMMAGMDLPSRVIREQIASAIDLVIQQNR